PHPVSLWPCGVESRIISTIGPVAHPSHQPPTNSVAGAAVTCPVCMDQVEYIAGCDVVVMLLARGHVEDSVFSTIKGSLETAKQGMRSMLEGLGK
ncbi:hypothetical protein KIPB_001928, partial [Kipferlia bialata]